MTSQAAERPPRTAVILPFLLLALAIACWPPVLSHFISLRWYLADMWPFAMVLSCGLLLGAVVAWVGRRRVGSALRLAFPNRRHMVFALMALFLSVLVSLAISEVTLRVLDLPYHTRWKPSDRGGWTPAEYRIARFSSITGWSYIPNLT